MRIVHLCSSGRVGGIETSVLAMLASLRVAEPSWQLVVVAPEDGPLLDGVRQIGCDGVALPFPEPLARFGEVSATRAGAARIVAGLSAAGYARRLRRALRAERPDIVHAHGIKMQVLSGWSAPRASSVVWHAHDYIAGRVASGRALRIAGRRCGAAIANSRSVAEDFREHVRRDLPVSVIYNAVDLARFDPEGAALDLDAVAGAAPAEPGTVRIGLPATFGRWKGQDVFLRALSRLRPGDRWRAYIIGDAVYRTRDSQWSLERLQSLARDLRVSDRVVFTGLVREMPAALRALDIVVHASTQPEPFGMTIAEAMACARATVVARAGGAAEIIHDEVDALGYVPGDVEGLARALAALVSDAGLRTRLGREARCTATRAFDARRLGPELVAVYLTAAAPAS